MKVKYQFFSNEEKQIIKRNFNNRIYEFRKHGKYKQLTQRDLAQRTGLSEKMVSRFEREDIPEYIYQIIALEKEMHMSVYEMGTGKKLE